VNQCKETKLAHSILPPFGLMPDGNSTGVRMVSWRFFGCSRMISMSAFMRRGRSSASEARIIYLIGGGGLVSLLSRQMKNGR
jgi:hypothetical protein